MSSSGLKPLTLKKVVQVHSKELRGVPEAGVSSCHLGSPASESQGFLLAIQVLGPIQIGQTLGPGPGVCMMTLTSRCHRACYSITLLILLGCKHQTV